MKKSGLYFLLSFAIISCKNDTDFENQITQIEVDFNIERFDKYFSESTEKDLPKLKESYPFMFPKNYHDEDWIARLNDTLQRQLHFEVNKAFENFPENEAIKSLFQHLKHYYKEFKVPRVITTTSDVDYKNKTIVTDTIVLIALDNYLGENHEFYSSIQQYLKQNFNRDMIVSDLASNYAMSYIFQSKTKTFLDDMIYFGKVLYFKDIMIPNTSDNTKIGYTKEQLEWARSNESAIWRYFVENELLYNTDQKLARRFINPAPFSKFNLELDRESPGRLGQYIGWQIVRAYMKNNDISFKQMLTKDAEDIFRSSRFKPKK